MSKKVIKKYRCDFCSKIFDSEKYCRKHEIECDKNPYNQIDYSEEEDLLDLEEE